MTDGLEIGEWSARLGPHGDPALIYETESKAPVASLHVPRAQEIQTALLLARAPTMLSAIRACIVVFEAMQTHGTERERLTAEDMLPVLRSSVYGLADRS